MHLTASGSNLLFWQFKIDSCPYLVFSTLHLSVVKFQFPVVRTADCTTVAHIHTYIHITVIAHQFVCTQLLWCLCAIDKIVVLQIIHLWLGIQQFHAWFRLDNTCIVQTGKKFTISIMQFPLLIHKVEYFLNFP